MDTRERILDAGQVVFASVGFAAARIEEICAAAEVNVRMIYAHFGSKQGLYQEVIRRTVERERSTQEDLTEGDPLTELKLRLRTFLNYCRENEDYVSLMLREAVDGYRTLNQVFEPGELRVADFVRLIERGQAQGVFRQDADPGLVGASALSLSLHLYRVLQSRGLRVGDRLTPEEVQDQIESILLRGIVRAGL